MQVGIHIPDDVSFSDLQLSRQPDGSISFDWSVVERICSESGLDTGIFRDMPEDNLCGLFVAWYHQHLAHGGCPCPTMDDLIGEARFEDALGGGFSHPPGTL